jgi:MarR family transcriptional regulator, organic hydroperoxide resistance regulator
MPETKDKVISETMQSLRRIFKAIHDYSKDVSGKFGITGPQLWALKTIAQDGSLPLGELSRKMYLHPSTISGVIDRLEDKGYVARARDKDTGDRRVIKVELTLKGKRIINKAPNPIQGKMLYGLRKLKKEDIDVIYQSVQKLVEIMEAQDLKVTFFYDQE